jgi:hypothetical protein
VGINLLRRDIVLTDFTFAAGSSAKGLRTTIDLDVDIGADAVDYNAIANQESLSGLETEMRKLEAIAGEVVNEMDYLKKRESKMRDTNGAFRPSLLAMGR